MLIAVDEFMGQYSFEFSEWIICCCVAIAIAVAVPAHGLDVRERKVNLLVVIVEVGSRRVCDAGEVVQDHGHGAGGWERWFEDRE